MELKERIIEEALSLFINYGVKGVTMHDISLKLGIGKNTIYQYFYNKDELVRAAIKLETKKHQIQLNSKQTEDDDAVIRLWSDIKNIEEFFRKLTPGLLYGLRKFHPQAFSGLMNYCDSVLCEVLQGDIVQGIAEGLYRKDLDVKGIIKFLLRDLLFIFDSEIAMSGFISQRSAEVNMTKHFIYGLTTKDGHELVDSYAALLRY